MKAGKRDEILRIYLLEYEKIKEEQVHRIGFRDNMIYLLLVTVGAIFSFALSKSNNIFALLLIPWISFILGWTYIINNEKISAIRNYFNTKLEKKISKLLKTKLDCVLLEWEVEHRIDKRWDQRKAIQFIIDITTFCGSGLVAVLTYWQSVPSKHTELIVLVVIELSVLFILGIQIFIYADLKKK